MPDRATVDAAEVNETDAHPRSSRPARAAPARAPLVRARRVGAPLAGALAAGVLALGTPPAAAHTTGVSAASYSVRTLCSAPARGRASCLALGLDPRASTRVPGARARRVTPAA